MDNRSATKPALPPENAINPQRALWAGIIFTVVALTSFGFAVFLVTRTPMWQTYAITAITAIALIADAIGVMWILRGRADLGLRYLYWSLIVTIPPNVFLVTNTAIFLIAIILVAGYVQVFYIQPRAWRKLYQFGPISAAVFMAIVEVIQPGFRANLTNVTATSGWFGPTALGFLIISLMGLIAYQAWGGGLRNKLLIVLSGVVVILVGAVTALSAYNAQNETQEDELLSLTRLYSDYNNDVEALTESAAALSTSLADREDIKQLYLANDREGMLALLTPMFETLRDEYEIRHLYIENPDGTVYVRVHNPANFGDDVTYRLTAATSLAAKKTVAGVEIGPNRIGVRSVSPLFENGKFIGMLEVGLDYDQAFIDKVKAHSGADYTMWVAYEAAASAGLKPAEGALPSPMADMFFYTSTVSTPFPIQAEVYQRVLQSREPELVYVTVEGNESAVLIAPMLGYGDRTIGILEISTSRSEVLATIQNDLRTELFTAGLFFLIGLALIWFASQYLVVRPLDQLAGVAQRQLQGDLSARTNVTTGDELEQLGQTLNSVTAQLQETLQGLEQRVADRTKALRTSAEVTRRLAAVTDPRQLAVDVVEEVQSAFHYYHAHIYYVEETTGDLAMAGGTGEAGATMLARGHKVPKGRGLVGRAAETNAPVLVPDVSQAEGWLPNPLLPDTRSEAAVPISLGKQVLGVLDVQQNVVNGLGNEDVDLLQSLAGQVAISLQNARTYEESRAKAELESLVNTIGQKIQRAASLEETLQTAIRELGMALGATRVRASITNRQNDGKDAVA